MLQSKAQGIYDEFLGIHTIQKIFAGDKTSFHAFLDELPFCLWIHDENFTIIHANRAFNKQFASCQTKKCHQWLMGSQKPCSCCLSKKTLGTRQVEYCKTCKRDHWGYDLNIFHTPITNDRGEKFIVKSCMHLDEHSIESCMLNKCNYDSNVVA